MYLFSIIVLCCLILNAFGRPSHVREDYDKEAKGESYGDAYRSDFDEHLNNRQKSSLKQFSANEDVSKEDSQDENVSNSDEEVNHAHPDKDYLENSDDSNDDDRGESAHLFHNDMLSTANDVKRTAEYNRVNNMLFQNNAKLPNVHRSETNERESVSQGEHAQYFKRYNTMRNSERDAEMSDTKRFNSEHDAITRDRRQVKNSESDESIGTEEISTQTNELDTNEDEETAIKRHIKKLSKEELNELLNSLSEDKRALLKNIIDNSGQEYDSINKREITKKAGANDENSFVGNEQSDASKIQGGSANIEADSSMSPNTENLGNTKKVESETMCSKTTEIVSSSEKSSDKVNILDSVEDTKLEKSDNKDNVDSSERESKIQDNTDVEQGTSKNLNKREMNSKSFIHSETNNNEPEIINPLNNGDLYCSENEDMSQLWNEESSLYNNNINKREVSSNNQNSMKSLEDSFPNSDETTNFKPGSDMVPLVRVKRKNSDKIVQKRDGNFISNLKVPFFSNAAENNEEDDEGSEFQDDGFFDRRANFAKSGELNKHGTDSFTYDGENSSKNCDHSSQIFDTDNNNLETDTVSLGSDSDAVLSGIEGVDDNMMYNGVARNKRTADELNGSLINENDNEKSKQRNTAISENEDNDISEGINQLSPRYQENDAFGSLPRNYEEDLGRFKRIRRLKPLVNSENNDSTLKQ